MKLMARVFAILVAALSVVGVALALATAFGVGQGGATVEARSEGAGDAGFESEGPLGSPLELRDASDEAAARGPGQRRDREGGGIFLGVIGGLFLVGGIMIATLRVERRIMLRRSVTSSARRAAGGKPGLGALERSE